MIYLIAVFGIIIGSFLNVCIYRIPKRDSIVTAPSHCTSCGKRIAWYDLVPIISYIILRGKCRSCKEKVSPQYPIVELLNGALWTAIYLSFGMNVTSVFYMILCSALLAIAFIDYYHQIIPDGILIFMLIFGVLFNIIGLDKGIMINAVIGFFVISVPLLLISMATRGGIGGGDIKLMAVCGIFIGFKLIITAFFLGIFFAGILSAVLLASKLKQKGDAIPLGPFLSMGVILSLFAGNGMIEWYLQFFR